MTSLASGEIVNAGADKHADLFAALKGGQNNSGVITRFDLAVFPQGDYWGGIIVQFPASADTAQPAAFEAFMDETAYDPYTEVEQSFVYRFSHPETPFSSSNSMFYARPV
ncbi:hypothetical protein BJX99DRAFT_262507 [Aspergillus californicus]